MLQSLFPAGFLSKVRIVAIKSHMSPVRVVQLVGASSGTPNGCQFDSQSGHIPKLWVQSLAWEHAGGNQSVIFLSHINVFLALPTPLLSLPPFLSLSVNKHILGWGIFKNSVWNFWGWEFSIEASITISSVSITIPILSTHPYRNHFNLLTNSCSFSFSSLDTGWMASSDEFLECHGHCKLSGLEPLFLNFNVLETHKRSLLNADYRHQPWDWLGVLELRPGGCMLDQLPQILVQG